MRLLVVAPEYRRQRLASRLLASVEDAARSSGELFVSTETVNVMMQAVLARLGYEPSGSIDHINAPGNAELVYHKRL